MKKIVLLLLLLISYMSLQAQTEKGRWTAGVSIGTFTYQSAQAGHNFSASLDPSVGRFVAPKFLVGLGLPISLTSSRYTNQSISSSSTNTTVGLSPFARYYFGTASWKPFFGLALTYQHFNLRHENSPNQVSTTRGNMLQVTPSVGLAYFINRSIALNAQLGYNWATSKSTGSDNYGGNYNNDLSAYTSKNVSLKLGFDIFFGQ